MRSNSPILVPKFQALALNVLAANWTASRRIRAWLPSCAR